MKILILINLSISRILMTKIKQNQTFLPIFNHYEIIKNESITKKYQVCSLQLYCSWDFSVHFIPESSTSTSSLLVSFHAVLQRRSFWHCDGFKKPLGKQTWHQALKIPSFFISFADSVVVLQYTVGKNKRAKRAMFFIKLL